MEYNLENKVPENKDALPSSDTLPGPFQATPVKDGPPASQQSNSVNVKKMQRMFKNAEENIRSIRAYFTELKEQVAKASIPKAASRLPGKNHLYGPKFLVSSSQFNFLFDQQGLFSISWIKSN